MMKYLQRVGRSLMLPVAVLPAAALLMGIGYWIDPSGWGGNNVAAAFLIKAGSSLIDNMSILFAVGIAYGMSEDQDGAASLSGLVAFLVVTTLLSSATVSMLTKTDIELVNPAFGKISNQFIGILSGVVAAEMYNKFHKVKLPDALAFFSGKRLAPIMTAVVMLAVSGILFFVWPIVYNGLVAFGTTISSMGALGAGIFGFFNRLLIPVGLHHALNAVFWFDAIGINDIGNFWAGTGVKGVTGMYQAGFFPIMMFGLLGGALAIYQTAKPENKKNVASLMMAAGFASFFTGITEPLEFSIMFVAPLLYLAHAALTGISMFIAATFHWTAGFGFSAGFVDFFLSLRLPLANQPFMLILQGLVFFVIYYLLFRFLIVQFDLKTPGREEVMEDAIADVAADQKYGAMAEIILEGIGGADNVTKVEFCSTRLRLEVKDDTIVNDAKIKTAGISGIVRPGKNSVQVIVGPYVQFVADEFKRLTK